MTKQEFQELLDRYANGQVSVSERALVEGFYARQQETEAGWTAFGPGRKHVLKKEIYQAIRNQKRVSGRPGTRRSRNVAWQVAASVAAVAALFAVGMWIGHRPAADVHYLTKATGKGQKATITLSDGSTVKLNAQSRISYPETFSADRREISLEGEAFFEVTKDAGRPFTVTSYAIQTTVLGTSFNIKAYSPEDISVALVTGKVKVEDAHQHRAYLSPGKMALYDHSSEEFSIGLFDHKQMTAWKDGIIYLSEASYTQVFDQLAQWYGVEFHFENRPADHWAYSGEFKNMSLELILHTIAYSKEFEFDIKKDLVTVKFENTDG